MGPRCWHLQELLLRPREEGQGFPHPWNRRHRPSWSPQRQARRCPEAAGHWPPARYWTTQAQRLPTEEGEPEVWSPPPPSSTCPRSLCLRTSTTSTSPGLRLRNPRRRETSSRPRRRPTSPLSRGRLIRLLLTLRSWPPSRATLTAPS